jgi:hypothetical protein
MKLYKLLVKDLTVEELIQYVINYRQAISQMTKSYNESTSSAFKRSVTCRIRHKQQVIAQLQELIQNLEAV